MQQRGPWERIASELVFESEHFTAYRDQVRRPDGKVGSYDWVSVPDQVRVAALFGNSLLLVDQYHYLIGPTLQLPGGSLEEGELSEEAARRELQQETGYAGGVWTSHGRLSPIPGLTPSRVHIWSAQDLAAGPTMPDSSERDLRTLLVPLDSARRAVLAGRVLCAASAALILLLTPT